MYVEDVIWLLLANFAARAVQTFGRCEQSYWRDGTLSGTINVCPVTEYIMSLSGASEKHNFGVPLKCLIKQQNITQNAGIRFVVILIIFVFVVNISVADMKCVLPGTGLQYALWFYFYFAYAAQLLFFLCCGMVVCQWNTMKWKLLWNISLHVWDMCLSVINRYLSSPDLFL